MKARKHDKPRKKQELSQMLVDSFSAFGRALEQQTQIMVIIHCNERYHDICVKLTTEISDDMRAQVTNLQLNASQYKITTKLIRYYLTYWLLQWDQYMYYQRGLLPEWIYESWLRQRYENYNMSRALSYLIPSPQTSGETLVDQRTADSEQALYRYGWEKAKQFYSPMKDGFADFATRLDRLMKANDEDEVREAVQALLKRWYG